MMEKYTLKADKKRQYHRKSTMSKAEIMVIMILFEFIELTLNYETKFGEANYEL